MLNRIKYIAHRANTAEKYHVDNQIDNSLDAVKNAMNNPHVSEIELDFQMTKDGHIVAMHDTNTRIVGNEFFKSKKVCDLTLEELRTYLMRDPVWEYRYSLLKSLREKDESYRKFYKDKLWTLGHVSTGKEIFDMVAEAESPKPILVELKDFRDACIEELAKLLNDYKDRIDFRIQSYSPEAVIRLKELTALKAGLLVKRGRNLEYLSLVKLQEYRDLFDFYSLEKGLFTPERLRILLGIFKKDLNVFTITGEIGLNRILSIIELLERELPTENYQVGIITDTTNLLVKSLTH